MVKTWIYNMKIKEACVCNYTRESKMQPLYGGAAPSSIFVHPRHHQHSKNLQHSPRINSYIPHRHIIEQFTCMYFFTSQHTWTERDLYVEKLWRGEDRGEEANQEEKRDGYLESAGAWRWRNGQMGLPLFLPQIHLPLCIPHVLPILTGGEIGRASCRERVYVLV